MDLKQQMLAAIAGKCHNDTAAEQAADACAKLAEANAVGFVEWASRNYTHAYTIGKWVDNDETWTGTTAELFTLYTTNKQG